MRCWSPLASTRCEPDRLLSIHPSRFSAASTRAALAMCSTVEHGHVKAGYACSISRIFCALRAVPRCHGMKNFTELTPAPSHLPAPFVRRLRLAVAAYLARFKGSSREHTESDLRCYLAWCAERGLDPLAAQRPHLELYIRWMQEIRRFKPSTVSRRFSVAAGSTGPASWTAS